jgi:hypothetical protein
MSFAPFPRDRRGLPLYEYHLWLCRYGADPDRLAVSVDPTRKTHTDPLNWYASSVDTVMGVEGVGTFPLELLRHEP